jgi:hypothetical protein
VTSYTLFSQGATGSGLTSDTEALTLGVVFSVSAPEPLQAIWFYSAAGATDLPSVIALYNEASQVLIASQAASWSGAAGSGWVRAPFSSPPGLAASTAYIGCAFHGSTGVNWYSSTAHYYDTGPGSGGITNPPLTAPDNSVGQNRFAASGSLAYPGSSFNATNYWVDIEVGTAAVPHTATASLTVTPSFTASRVRGKYRTGALAAAPSFSASRTRGKHRAGSLTVTPSFSAARLLNHGRHATLAVVPSFSAARTRGRYRAAALAAVPAFTALRAAGRARGAALTVTPRFTAVPSGGVSRFVVFSAGAPRGLWIGGGLPSYSQSVLSTQYIQVPVTVRSASPYNPSGDAVQFAFVPVTYPQAAPSVWYTGSWSVFPGPVYWAQILVGPANGGVALAAGSYEAWLKITDSPEIPVLQPFILTITP